MPLAPDAIAYYVLHIIAIPLSVFTFMIYRCNTHYSIIAYYSLTTIILALITCPIAFISNGGSANTELCTFQGMIVSYCLVAIAIWILSVTFSMWWRIFKGEIETPTWIWLGTWLLPILGTTAASIVAARNGGIKEWNYFCMITEPLVATSLGVFLIISLSGLGASVLSGINAFALYQFWKGKRQGIFADEIEMHLRTLTFGIANSITLLILSGTRIIQIISLNDLPIYSAYPDFVTCLFPYITFFAFSTTAEARRYWVPRWLSSPCVDRANNVLDQFSIVYPPKKASTLSERGVNGKNSRNNEDLSSIYTESYTGEPSRVMTEQRNSQHSGFLQVAAAPLTHDPSRVKGKKRASDTFRASVHQFLRASITSVNQLGSRISPQFISHQQDDPFPYPTKSDISQDVNITIDDPEHSSFNNFSRPYEKGLGNWQAEGGAPSRTSQNRDSFPVYPSAQLNYPMARRDETEQKEQKSRKSLYEIYKRIRKDAKARKSKRSSRDRVFSTPMISSSARFTSSHRTASFSYPPKKSIQRDSISGDLRFLKAFSFELRKGNRILDVPSEYVLRSASQSVASLSLREVEKDDNLQPTSSSPLPSSTFNEHGQKVFDNKSLRITNQLDIELEVAAPLSHEVPSLSVTRPHSSSSLSSSSLLPNSPPTTQRPLRKVPRPPQLIIPPPPPSPNKLKPAHLSRQKSFSFLNNSPSESSSNYSTRGYPSHTQVSGEEDTTDSRRYTRSTTASSGSTLSRDSYERTSPNGLRLTPKASMPVYTLNLPPLPNSERNSWDNSRRRESLGSIPSVVGEEEEEEQ